MTGTVPGLPAAAVAGGKPLLVLVHGYLGGGAQWRGEIAALSDRFDILAPTLPGFGDAAALPAPASIGAFAEHVLSEVARRAAARRFMLLGHSMGGMIAQEVARRAPDRVTRLILYGTGPLGAMPDRFEPLEVSADRLARDGVAATARRIAATWFVAGERHPAFGPACEIAAKAAAPAALTALRAMAEWDGRAALGTLTVPALVLWGERDRSYRWPQVEQLWTGLPDASLAVLPNAAHAAHLEKPWLVHALIRDFLLAERVAAA